MRIALAQAPERAFAWSLRAAAAASRLAGRTAHSYALLSLGAARRHPFLAVLAVLSVLAFGVHALSFTWGYHYGPPHVDAWYAVTVRDGEARMRIWVDRPYQRQREDDWLLRIPLLGCYMFYGGTYCPPGTVKLRGVFYEASSPVWLTGLVLGAAPGYAFLRFVWLRRRRRHATQEPLCETCGYSLTGNVSGRCPECGKTCPGKVPPATAAP